MSDLDKELLVGNNHLSGAEGPVVDGFGRGLRGAGEGLLGAAPRPDQLDGGRHLRLDCGGNLSLAQFRTTK